MPIYKTKLKNRKLHWFLEAICQFEMSCFFPVPCMKGVCGVFLRVFMFALPCWWPWIPAWFIHQAFSDYQLQQMTSNFIDQFGFNEEEFGEHEEKTE